MNTENQKIFARVFSEAKFSPHASAALMGRIQVESGFNTKAHNAKDPGKRGSVGAMQWNRERLEALDSFAADRGTDIYDPETQALFTVAEVTGKIGTEGAYGKAILEAPDAVSATKAAMGFARPEGWTAKNPERGLGYNKTLRATADLLGVDLKEAEYANRSDATAKKREAVGLTTEEFNAILADSEKTKAPWDGLRTATVADESEKKSQTALGLLAAGVMGALKGIDDSPVPIKAHSSSIPQPDSIQGFLSSLKSIGK